MKNRTSRAWYQSLRGSESDVIVPVLRPHNPMPKPESQVFQHEILGLTHLETNSSRDLLILRLAYLGTYSSRVTKHSYIHSNTWIYNKNAKDLLISNYFVVHFTQVQGFRKRDLGTYSCRVTKSTVIVSRCFRAAIGAADYHYPEQRQILFSHFRPIRSTPYLLS